MNSITIIAMCEKHLDAVSAIESDVFSDPWSRAMFVQDMNTDYGQCYVAMSDGVVIGYVNAWFVGGECTINRIACSKHMQRSGIAEQLLNFLIRTAAGLGVMTFFLEVRASNMAAQRFYEKAGFVKSGLRKAYYTDTLEDAILMTMSIFNQKQACRNDT
jgi:[ribosomal protein S18]-alanine N-acetyltransferase